MQPEGKEYEKLVVIPKVWEEVLDKDGEIVHVLISEEVSAYVRNLERSIELFMKKKYIKNTNPFKNISIY